MKMKPVLSLMMALLITLSLFAAIPITANAADEALADIGADYSGTTGDCTWEIKDYVLTISGNGAMADYDKSTKETSAPWRYLRAKEVIIEKGVTIIGACAFDGCDELTKVTIADTVTGILDHAFSMCRYLKDVKLPDSITSIGEYAFYGCHSLPNIHIPDGVTRIKHTAFYSCSKLKSIVIPNSVMVIEDFTFYGCKELKLVKLPDGVKSIGEYAFANCPALLNITVPAGVVEIGDYALGFNSYQHVKDFAIYGTAGSIAEQYATKNNFVFIEGVEPAPIIILGDVDNDDNVTILDATAIQRFLANVPNDYFEEKAADADEDGVIGILDVTEIQRYLAKLSANNSIGYPVVEPTNE